MEKPVLNQVRGVFIPVSNIENARDWYCRLLGLPTDGEIFFGHIYVLPMEGGTNIVLDSKMYSVESIHNVPVIQLASDDIEKSYKLLQAQHVEIITEIQNNHWFNIKDPYGNVLMVCE
ncbi:VOC family protein [Paenibacillus amylolyticus]|uniref:VOC family protein n=1 Tax=Paenibacillus amylolyticus TaxID=1451 RepID=UPI003D99BBFB